MTSKTRKPFLEKLHEPNNDNFNELIRYCDSHTLLLLLDNSLLATMTLRSIRESIGGEIRENVPSVGVDLFCKSRVFVTGNSGEIVW